MKRIMIFTAILHGGGAERVASVFCNGLIARGYDVVLLLYGRADDEYELSDKVRVKTIAENYQEYKKLKPLQKVCRIRAIVKSEKPDYIINFLPEPQMWMYLSTRGMRMKRIETVRSNPWVMTENGGLASKLWKQCFYGARSIIIQTQEQGEFFEGRNKEKCVWIPNPLKDEFYHAEQKRCGIDTKKMLAAGRLADAKNYPMMIKAVALASKNVEGLQLDIYGGGDEDAFEYLQLLIDQEGCKDIIHLKGRVDNMEEIYQEYGVFLMSSDYEGLSNALMEAMASGCICISTDCKTGPKELIEDGLSGFLTPVKSEVDFVDKITFVNHLTEEEKKSISARAVERINSLCEKSEIIDKLEKIIER